MKRGVKERVREWERKTESEREREYEIQIGASLVQERNINTLLNYTKIWSQFYEKRLNLSKFG